MKYVYPAVFKEENGQYLASVPDLPGCHTFGDDLNDAIEMTRDAMAMWLCIAEDKKEAVPEPTLDIKAADGYVSFVDVDTMAYRRQTDSRAVKKTLSIPSWLNSQAEREHVNFSEVLQNALMEQLNITK
ncbi:MAG: type II toxin-antitoxin system HicB family antitoxin [Oscillospiraceae bacterium]|nr:type II toxin-antitoxin system HicB family antitoxin [Oscillospiraceae bacterium]